MSWIALKMLIGDRAKFFGIVLGLTFAALLITQQGSIFCGLMSRTAGQIHDITGADLWVMDSNVRFIDDVKPMRESNLYRVRGVEGVRWAVPLYKGNGRAKINSVGFALNPDFSPRLDPKTGQRIWGQRHEVIEQVILIGLDDASMVGAPPPSRILVGDLTDLRRPDAVIVDYNRLQKLFPGDDWKQEPKRPSFFAEVGKAVREFAKHPATGTRYLVGQVVWMGDVTLGRLGRWATGSTATTWAPAAASLRYPFPTLENDYNRQRGEFSRRFVGRELEMNDHRAIIVGVCDATRTFQSNAVMYTTYTRAKSFAPQERKILSYVLAKAEPGVPASVVASRIKDQTGLKALTSREFIDNTYEYYLKYTGIPINFGITAMLGFVIGTAIAGQTFYLFTIDNLKQFGALKAMGATNMTIVGMILLQATVVGLLGYGLGVGLAALFGEVTKGGELAFFTHWSILPITGVSVVLICVLSSILSVRRVVVLEPAVVFRG
ncbi:MAG: ABC transporter permease [Isosphaeraceae bacterium]